MATTGSGSGDLCQIEGALGDWAWLGALCQRIVADPGLASDAQQEAWIAATEVGTKPATRTRLVLAVRQYLWRHRRSAERRDRRELEHAPREDAPSTTELVARSEQYQRVWRAVLDLEEPYRETLLLHFQEGLSSADIARLKGVPPDTIRWRLRRGIESLRRSLDDDASGLLALASVVPSGLPHTAAPVVSTPSLLFLVATMKATSLLIIGLVIALFAVVFLSNRDASSRASAADVREAAAAAEALDGPRPTVRRSTALIDPESGVAPVSEPSRLPTQPEASATTVTGYIVADGDVPLSGVRVSQHGLTSQTVGAPTGASLSDGRFRLDVVDVDGPLELRFEGGPGLEGKIVPVHDLKDARAPGAQDVGTISLTRLPGIHGRLVRAGVPIPGATMTIGHGDPVTLRRRGETYCLPASSSIPRAFQPGFWMTEDCHDLGEPGPKAWLSATMSRNGEPVVSDAEGRFFFAAEERGAAVVGCRHGGDVARSTALEFLPDEVLDIGDMELRAGGTIKGRIVDQQGLPIVEAEVSSDGGQAAQKVVSVTDENGRFEFVGCATGDQFLRLVLTGDTYAAPAEAVEVYHVGVLAGDETLVTVTVPTLPSRLVEFKVIHNGVTSTGFDLGFETQADHRGHLLGSASAEGSETATVRLPIGQPIEVFADFSDLESESSALYSGPILITEDTGIVELSFETCALKIALPVDADIPEGCLVFLHAFDRKAQREIQREGYARTLDEGFGVQFDCVPTTAELTRLVAADETTWPEGELVAWTMLQGVRLAPGETTVATAKDFRLVEPSAASTTDR